MEARREAGHTSVEGPSTSPEQVPTSPLVGDAARRRSRTCGLSRSTALRRVQSRCRPPRRPELCQPCRPAPRCPRCSARWPSCPMPARGRPVPAPPTVALPVVARQTAAVPVRATSLSGEPSDPHPAPQSPRRSATRPCRIRRPGPGARWPRRDHAAAGGSRADRRAAGCWKGTDAGTVGRTRCPLTYGAAVPGAPSSGASRPFLPNHSRVDHDRHAPWRHLLAPPDNPSSTAEPRVRRYSTRCRSGAA